MTHRWLIGVSVAAHLAVGVGLFVSGVWRIERLDNQFKFSSGIGVMLPPQESSGPRPGEKPRDPEKKVVKKKPPVLTQLEDKKPPVVPDIGEGGNKDVVVGISDSIDGPTCPDNNCAPAARREPTCGDGTRDANEECDDGNNTAGDGCSSTCRIEPRRETRVVAPNVLQALRISGETQVHPSTITQNQMIREGVVKANASFYVCIATDGSVASATLKVSTSYPEYDATMLAAVKGWRYQPYMFNGTAVPACSMVTFIYTIK